VQGKTDESPKWPLQLAISKMWIRTIRYENTTFTREASMMVSSVVLGPYLNRGHGHSNELELEVYDICVETAKHEIANTQTLFVGTAVSGAEERFQVPIDPDSKGCARAAPGTNLPIWTAPRGV
jgi:hypothetical protein